MLSHTSKVEIDAILDEEVDTFLDRLGIKKEFDAGDFRCSVCGRIITRENLKLIIPSETHFEFVCDNPVCMIRFTLGD